MTTVTGPAQLLSFEAVIFDMDGTLIDSEDRGEDAIRVLLESRGVDCEGAGRLTRFRGATWEYIANELCRAFPTLAGSALAADLQGSFHASLLAAPPPEIPGAKAALVAALRSFPTAVATSSNRESLELALRQLGVAGKGLVTVCAEDVRRSKPAPDGFLTAAERLGVPASRCLVFEDSDAGISAAGAAGMTVVAIAAGRSRDERRKLQARASLVISDFTKLPPGFFARPSADAGP